MRDKLIPKVKMKNKKMKIRTNIKSFIFNPLTYKLVDDKKNNCLNIFNKKNLSTPEVILCKTIESTKKSMASIFKNEDIFELTNQEKYDALTYKNGFYDRFKSNYFLQKYGMSFKEDKDSNKLHHFRTFNTDGKRHICFDSKKSKYFYRDNWQVTDIPIFTIYKFLAENYEAGAVFSGYCHNLRNVIVVDIDSTFEESNLEKIISFLKIKNIPLPNIVTINEKPKDNQVPRHYQLQWYLKEGLSYFNPNEDFLNVVHILNYALGGDPHFTNGYIKNPFCKSQTTYEISGFSNLIDFSSFKTQVLSLLPEVNLNLKEKSNVKRKSKKSVVYNNIPSDSRHQFSLNEEVKNVFRYMNTHEGALPPDDVIEREVIELQLQKVRELKDPLKTGAESPSQIKSIVKNVKQFCSKNYKESYKTSNRNIPLKSRKEGAQLNRIKALINAYCAFNMRNKGKGKKDIAKQIGVSISCLNSYYAKYNYRDVIQDLVAWYKEHKKDKGEHFKKAAESIYNLIIKYLKNNIKIIYKKIRKIVNKFTIRFIDNYKYVCYTPRNDIAH